MPVFDLPEADLYYQARGAGPPALFVHGFSLDHTTWLRQLDALAPLRRCVAVDLRGHGRSGIGTDPAGAANHHLDDLLAIVEALGGAADLVGHSMGAHLARSLAVAHPNAVRSLVLIGVMRPSDYTFGGSRSPDLLREPKQDLVARFADGMLAPEAPLPARTRARDDRGCRLERSLSADGLGSDTTGAVTASARPAWDGSCGPHHPARQGAPVRGGLRRCADDSLRVVRAPGSRREP